MAVPASSVDRRWIVGAPGRRPGRPGGRPTAARGAGGNRTPVRRGVIACATTIPVMQLHGCCTAGSAATPRGCVPPGLSPGSAVFACCQRSLPPSITASVAGLQRSDPAWPHGSRCSSCYLGSGGESEVSFVAASVEPRLTSLSNSGRTHDFPSRRRNRSAPKECLLSGVETVDPAAGGAGCGAPTMSRSAGRSRTSSVPPGRPAGRRHQRRLRLASSRRASRSASRLASSWRLSTVLRPRPTPSSTLARLSLK